MKTNLTAAKARQALAFGYSLPIVGTTVAILFGLIVRDLTATDLQSWIWVLIQSVICSSLILGTYFSNLADGFRTKSNAKLPASVGARVMNFVLAIFWTIVTTFQAFGFGSASVDKLRNYTDTGVVVNPLTPDIFLNDWVPAFMLVLIAAVGTYILMWARAVDTAFEAAK
jgi:hypothetical protein